MSKPRLFLSLTAITGLLILAGGLGVWAFPLRAPGQAASAGSQAAEKEIPPYASAAIQPVRQLGIVYPPAAKKAGIQGNVRLRVTINKDGSVMDIRVLSGNPQLVKASLERVPQWRYAPSKDVRVTVVTISFTLAKGGAAVQPQASGDAPPLAKTAPKLVTRINPVYPPAAKKAGIQGIVVLRTTIERNGSVSNLKVLHGNPQLVKAALDAVQQWRYAPVEKVVTTDVTITFSLAEGGGLAPGADSGAKGGVYTVGDGVSAPIPIYKPEPSYTKEARAAKLQGTVVLWIIVGADGAVTDAKVVEPFDKGLDENAVQAVKTWKFKPAVKAGKPVMCREMVEISFKLF